jgi:hypothetical protein
MIIIVTDNSSLSQQRLKYSTLFFYINFITIAYLIFGENFFRKRDLGTLLAAVDAGGWWLGFIHYSADMEGALLRYFCPVSCRCLLAWACASVFDFRF